MKLFKIKKEDQKYLSDSLWNPLPTLPVFGGQIVSQALNAAYDTVDEAAEIHSLHCYFLKPAGVDKEIEYKIETIKDGNLLENRNVKAYQNDVIFNMCASFTKSNKNGVTHQQKELINDNYIKFNDLVLKIKPELSEHLSFLDEYVNIYKGEKSYKFELKKKFNKREMTCCIAFLSDLFLLESALGIMHENLFSKNISKVASIDHSVYFHSSSEDGVLYFVPECLSINDGKAFCLGYIFDGNKTHIATACQEGLIKLNNKD